MSVDDSVVNEINKVGKKLVEESLGDSGVIEERRASIVMR